MISSTRIWPTATTASGAADLPLNWPLTGQFVGGKTRGDDDPVWTSQKTAEESRELAARSHVEQVREDLRTPRYSQGQMSAMWVLEAGTRQAIRRTRSTINAAMTKYDRPKRLLSPGTVRGQPQLLLVGLRPGSIRPVQAALGSRTRAFREGKTIYKAERPGRSLMSGVTPGLAPRLFLVWLDTAACGASAQARGWARYCFSFRAWAHEAGTETPQCVGMVEFGQGQAAPSVG